MNDKCTAVTVDEQLKCAICLDTWRHPVEVLPCRHVFCRQCISTVSQCPMCRGPIRGAQSPSRPLVCLSDEVQVECSECHWKGTREQSYTHPCNGTSVPAPRSAAVPAHVDPSSSAPRLQEQAANPNYARTVVASSVPELAYAEVIAFNTADFSDQEGRVDLAALVSPPDTLRVIAKNCVNLTDIATVVACINLVEVNFAGCTNLRDMTPLRRLMWLKTVNLSATAVRNISFAASCPALEHIDVSGAKQLRDLSPLKKCQKLRQVFIQNTSITSISALSDMESLESLNATDCAQLRDFSPLESCWELKVLRVRRTPVADFAMLRYQHGLEILSVGQCARLTDLYSIGNCSSLRELYIQNTSVANIGPMRTFKSLEIFNATGCAKLHSLSSLRACHKLRQLYVGGTSVTDLSVLRGLMYLETVWASNSRVFTIDGLDTCPRLTTLKLDGTPRSDYSLPIR